MERSVVVQCRNAKDGKLHRLRFHDLREALAIHDALQGTYGAIGVKDARIARTCGDEIVLVEAARQG